MSIFKKEKESFPNRLTESLRSYSRLFLRIDDPVVVLEGVHGLQDGGHPPHVGVDPGVRQELRGQVGVELGLHCGRGVDPQRWVEETVVQELLQQQVRVGGGAGDQVLCQLEEGVQEVGGGCSREDLPSRCEMTRNPLPEITCCWMDGEDSISSQMKLISLELERGKKVSKC